MGNNLCQKIIIIERKLHSIVFVHQSNTSSVFETDNDAILSINGIDAHY